MYCFLLFFCILNISLRNCVSVHPGDPFPTDRDKSKTPSSEDLIGTEEIEQSFDNEFPSLVESITDSFEVVSEEESTTTTTKSTTTTKIHKTEIIEKVSLSTTTKITTTPRFHDYNLIGKKKNSEEKSSLPQESTTVLPIKSFSQKNLLKIGRWKYIDPQTKLSRYWYEPEGGIMGTGWTFDGFIFQAYSRPILNTEPVYAFHSEIRTIWTNTIQMDPRPPIVGNDQWISDGVLFYAYKTSMNSTELLPVVRYWNKLKQGATDATETRITYLMTIDEQKNMENQSEWIFDTILFHVLPIGY